MPSYSIKITDTDSQISKNIIRAILPEIAGFMQKAEGGIRAEVRAALATEVNNSPTWKSLTDGGSESLREHFGFVPAKDISSILAAWLSSINTNVRVRSSGTELTGRLTIHGVRSDYQDVISMTIASVLNISERYPGGLVLPWLEWLLLSGDDRFVQNFKISFRSYAKSRSGGAIMVEKDGASWHVPPEHASAGEMNFITNAIGKVLSDNIMGDILQRNFEKRVM